MWRNIKLSIQYDGTLFHGWQKQQSLRTIQQCIEDALLRIVRDKVNVIAAGRTDAGVHACGQVAHFYTGSSIDASRLLNALNSVLPGDVRVFECKDVAHDFHARFSAQRREYLYVLYCGDVCPPFYSRYVCHVRHLNIERFQQTLQYFAGEHDYSSFCSASDPHPNKVCSVYRVCFVQKGRFVVVSIQANRFLRKMIRMLVGFALDSNSKDIDVYAEVHRLLSLKDRRAHAYSTAEPQGLFLNRVWY